MKFVLGTVYVVGLIASFLAGVMITAYLTEKFIDAIFEYGGFKVFFVVLMVACFCIFMGLILEYSGVVSEKKEENK